MKLEEGLFVVVHVLVDMDELQTLTQGDCLGAVRTPIAAEDFDYRVSCRVPCSETWSSAA